MSKFAFGIASIQKGDIDPVTGLPSNLADVGDVVKDSGMMETADGETTEHYSEFSEDPVLVQDQKGVTEFRFELFDTRAETLEEYMGGTIVSAAGAANKWNAPDNAPNIEKAFEITTDDGTVITINRAKVKAKLRMSATKKGVTVLEVVARALKPKIDGVKSIVFTDNFSQP